MRICFISAGTFTHVGAYLDYFREAGHDVHFIALSPSPPRSVPTHEVGVRGGWFPLHPRWQYPLGMLRARALIRGLKPDVVHAQYATSGGAAGLVCGFRPLVVTAHGSDLTGAMGSAPRRALLRAVFAEASCVNTVSADLTRMAERLGVPRSKIVEMTLGVDTARFHGAGREPRGGELRLVCTRRFEEVYDHRTIIEALSLLKEKGVRFRMTFAGDGALRARCEALIAERGLAGQVEFVGEVGGNEMPEMLRAHDVYLSASRADGTSLSLLEAMSCGLFPVVTRIPANEAWIEHGAGGFLHGAGDARGLAEAVEEIAARPRLALSAAALNRGKAREAGDRRTNMRRLEKVYESLVKPLPRGDTASAAAGV